MKNNSIDALLKSERAIRSRQVRLAVLLVDLRRGWLEEPARLYCPDDDWSYS
jgi:hypothetical protein